MAQFSMEISRPTGSVPRENQQPDILSRRRLSAQSLCVGRTEFPAPAPDRFVGHDNAALQQHFFHQPQA